MSEEETQDIQQEAVEYAIKNDMMQDSESRTAYNSVDIQDKLIEPDKSLSGNIAISNLQLGNITEEDYYGNLHEVNFAMDCMDMPFECGGFFLNDIGIKIMKKLDVAHIMSGSKLAKKWDSLTQDKKVNVLRREEPVKKKGMNIFKR